ncbi:helix-turn-helix protein [anaerobic digester metagenome]
MENSVTKGFSEKLRDLISLSGKSIKQLSLELGIPSGSLSKYQNDAAEPGINNLYKIAEYFNVSTDYLLGLSNVKSFDLDIKAISEKTGLSDDAVQILANFSTEKKDIVNIINFLIELEKPWLEFNQFIEEPFCGLYIDGDNFTEEGIEHGNKYKKIQDAIFEMHKSNTNILEIIADFFKVMKSEKTLFLTRNEIKKEEEFSNFTDLGNETIKTIKQDDYIEYAFLSEIQIGLKNLKKIYLEKYGKPENQ